MPDRTAPLTRRGPYVHALIGGDWAQRRAFLARRPLRCDLCRLRVEAGETVIRTPGGMGFACGSCILTHPRGDAACILCRRLTMSGRRCRHCGGAGYGSDDEL